MRDWPSASQERGFFLPVAEALTVGVVFVAVLLIGYHSPRPRDGRVDVVGSPASVPALVHQCQSKKTEGSRPCPGSLERNRPRIATRGTDIRRPHSKQQSNSLRCRRQRAVSDIWPRNELLHSMISQSAPLHTVDMLPLLPNDTSGLPLFYPVFGVVIASYLFGIASVTTGRSLSPTGRWAPASLLASLLAALSTLIARFSTQTINGHATIVFLFLLSLVVGEEQRCSSVSSTPFAQPWPLWSWCTR